MDNLELERWVEEVRDDVYAYLEGQGIQKPNIDEWPAFEVAPYFSIWAIESQRNPGKIGWWAFSGDCPTDYVSEDGECHPRAALKTLIENWQGYILHMKQGIQPPKTKIGKGENLYELAELLSSRIDILREWEEDDSIWREN